MTLQLTIDDPTEAARIIDDFCAGTAYDPGSGKTKAQWVVQKLSEHIKLTAMRGEVKTQAVLIRSQIDAIVIH